MGGDSVIWLRCPDATLAPNDVNQQCKMAAPVSLIFWLHFCAAGRSGDTSYISLTVRLALTDTRPPSRHFPTSRASFKWPEAASSASSSESGTRVTPL